MIIILSIWFSSGEITYSGIKLYEQATCAIYILSDKYTIIVLINNKKTKCILCTKWKHNANIIALIIFGPKCVLWCHTIYKSKHISNSRWMEKSITRSMNNMKSKCIFFFKLYSKCAYMCDNIYETKYIICEIVRVELSY